MAIINFKSAVVTRFNKYANSETHCETPKMTEIVKIAIFSGFSDF